MVNVTIQGHMHCKHEFGHVSFSIDERRTGIRMSQRARWVILSRLDISIYLNGRTSGVFQMMAA